MMVEIAAGFVIAYVVVSAWWQGRAVACLESIAKSLKEEP
jgi:hypothetical protein